MAFSFFRKRSAQSDRNRRLQNTRQQRKCMVEPLEHRQLLAVLFADSFEHGGGADNWDNDWFEDSQNDWFRSTQRATDGVQSAEVAGRATDATLTLANSLDLSGFTSVELTFDWLIENRFDRGEYVSLDVSSNGGATWQNGVRQLNGNVDAENTWHNETVDLTPYASSDVIVRFRAKASRSNEDANVDNVQMVGMLPAGTPEISIGDTTANEFGDSYSLIDEFIRNGGALDDGRGVTVGPTDGNVYVASSNPAAVLRYDGVTGAFIDSFADASIAGDDPRTGELLFGPDGNLYVTTAKNDSVLQFDGTTSALISEFVTPGAGGLDRAFGMRFGPNGDLYVTSQVTHEVLRYDGVTGTFIDAYIASGSGGLNQPNSLEIGSDGNFYVGSSGTDEILRYQGPNNVTPGAFIDAFVTAGSGGLDFPPSGGITFGPDGDLFVTSRASDQVLRYDGDTGAFVEEIANGSDGIDAPKGLAFGDDGTLLVVNPTSDEVLRYGTDAHARFNVSLSAPAATNVTVDFVTADGTAKIADGDYQMTSGTLVFAPGETTRTIVVPIFDDTVEEGDEDFFVDLSNAQGAMIAGSGQSVGTILDDDAPATPNTIYVYDISFESKRGGKDRRAVFQIRSDSNANGTGDAGDNVAAGVTIEVTFAGNTYTGTTTSNGEFKTAWIRKIGSGDHYANAVDLALTDYVWNPLALDLEDDSDGDGKPDDVLSN